MLILGRRPGESILIDGGIRLIVISCDRRGVRLGIEAPSHVGIVRGEIVSQIADENRRAQVAATAGEWLPGLAARQPATDLGCAPAGPQTGEPAWLAERSRPVVPSPLVLPPDAGPTPRGPGAPARSGD